MDFSGVKPSAEQDVQIKKKRILEGTISKRALKRLEALGFDPLTESVKLYDVLKSEMQTQQLIKSGKLKELTKDGHAKPYSVFRTLEIADRMHKVADSLMKYAYAPIANEEQPMAPPTMQVVLHSDNTKFSIAPPQDLLPDE
jgi:hypothetical protein